MGVVNTTTIYYLWINGTGVTTLSYLVLQFWLFRILNSSSRFSFWALSSQFSSRERSENVLDSKFKCYI